MSQANTALVEMLKIQYNDGFAMLKKLVEGCPDDLWQSENHGLPVWNHIIHTLMGTAFWLRTDYCGDFRFYFPLPENVKEKLEKDEWCGSQDGFMTKEEVSVCIDILEKKLEEFWSSLTDDMLTEKIWGQYCFTYLSVITAQIRHVMCHVGMCNAALIENGFDEIEWIAFGES